ncbi:MAG: FAD-dependent oxidoreductase [Cyclobacteriaceae bacterium]|nr:FAD-dependent oxidoreductase [Cyclobacteriaceae bacterium]
MRSGLTVLLRSAFAQAACPGTDYGRRDFMKKSALAAMALSIPFASCKSKEKPVVAIVGGGIAGLTTSYYLTKWGIAHILFEGNSRLGGRVLTVENAVIDQAHVDFGAEFIDTIHDDLLLLAKELKVEVVNLGEDMLKAKGYFFDGKMFSEEDLVKAIQPFADVLAKDINRIPEELHFSKAEQFQDIDQHSVTSYLQSIGMSGWLMHFFEMAMEGEYAMNASEQSAINLLVMLSAPFHYSEHYHLLGSYHEVFKFKGGTQRFIDALSTGVDQHVKLGYRLKKLLKNEDQYSLSFDVNGKPKVVTADIVVLALPFTVLRDIERDFKFSERKERWIAEAGFGNAIKVAMGFNKRVWREAGFQGYTFTDVNRTVFWDSAQLIPTTAGSLSFAGGGDSATELATKSYTEIKEKWLTGADTIYPGLAAQYNGKISKFPWSVNPFSKGSYTAYKKGQWSAFAGVEAEPFENIFFAGEHCSVAHQGFMNGAAETGRGAAEAIHKKLTEIGES